ncbi:hypothetical protein [Pseudomonas sp. R5(2019)]|uniref:hypothetical protein n=1 Tax=Pseudomonas sp. R5(2019) TaxID=2697566 RepID=UPI001412107B|nr:hypothetical protein [Pseudomonas sp. R5(2019)]
MRDRATIDTFCVNYDANDNDYLLEVNTHIITIQVIWRTRFQEAGIEMPQAIEAWDGKNVEDPGSFQSQCSA